MGGQTASGKTDTHKSLESPWERQTSEKSVKAPGEMGQEEGQTSRRAAPAAQEKRKKIGSQ